MDVEVRYRAMGRRVEPTAQRPHVEHRPKRGQSMRQRCIVTIAGVVFAAAAALSMAGRTYAADACKQNCKPAFDFCKDRAKTQFNDAKPAIAGIKENCKGLDKSDRKPCLQGYKDTKKAAKQAKKDQLKACKEASKCRSETCKNAADDTCSPTGGVVGSPGDSFQDCHETNFID